MIKVACRYFLIGCFRSGLFQIYKIQYIYYAVTVGVAGGVYIVENIDLIDYSRIIGVIFTVGVKGYYNRVGIERQIITKQLIAVNAVRSVIIYNVAFCKIKRKRCDLNLEY